MSKDRFAGPASDVGVTTAPDGAVGNAELIAHTAEFEKRIYRVEDAIHVAVGYSLANSVMIEGDDGVIIIDVLEDMDAATEVAAEFRKISDKPVVAIILTHNHADHVLGCRAFVPDSEVPIYAHATTMHFIERFVHTLAPATARRAAKQFGSFLQDPEDGIINCGIGPFLSVGERSLAIPTHTYQDELELAIAGVNLRLLHTPGETSDATSVWLPDKKLCIVGDLLYRAFPNVYALRGTQYRSPYDWAKAVDKVRALKPENLILGHSKPISGKERILGTMTAYRDGLQFVYDQTIRGINQGYTPDELVETVRLPPHLQDHPYLREYYGMIPHHVRATFVGELGWFDGDPVNLFPLSPTEEAMNMVKLSGGTGNILVHIRMAIEDEQYQWGAQLATYLLRTEPQLEEARLLKAKALRALGQRTSSSNMRNFYLTEAETLEDKIAIDGIPIHAVFHRVLPTLPVGTILEGLHVRLNPLKSSNVDMVVGFRFTDANESYAYHVRGGVAEFKSVFPDKHHVAVIGDSMTWVEVMIGARNLNAAIETGNVIVEGPLSELEVFLDLFDSNPPF
ncbi:MAG: alkyl sulfatase dimerization domain-containing protein [Candidatus Thorarchaeota archaeon]